MRDGVKLSTNVYLPKGGEGPFPVVMNRTPYVKDSAARSVARNNARLFADAGYAVVHMDVRGRGDSEGKFTPYFQEIEDGYDSFEWAGGQQWSNGRVGTWGGSYEGWVQIFPMRLQSKYHKAAFPPVHAVYASLPRLLCVYLWRA